MVVQQLTNQNRHKISIAIDLVAGWVPIHELTSKNSVSIYGCTVCPRSSDQFYIVTYYINWVATSWTNGSIDTSLLPVSFIYFFLGFLGRMSMVLQMMPSITSSAPPPIEFRLMSLNNAGLISNLIFIFATARHLNKQYSTFISSS